VSETTQPGAAEGLEGIRQPATDDWIAAHTDEVEPPFEWTRLTGGTSNLTYAIRDARGRHAVVRRPPTGKLLPKAHDMEREHKILAGLADTPVPVARPYAVCHDREVTGAPFYVMEFCEGRTAAAVLGSLREWNSEARSRMGASMVDAMVELHAVDPADVGLADLGRPENYVERQLKRWLDSWQRSDEAAGIDLPSVLESFETLSKCIPAQGPARVCHGDYGPHNLLVLDDGSVRAITDWEISTLGDPLADFTYFLWSWGEQTLDSEEAFLDSRSGDDYASRRELLSRYEQRSGRAVENLWFYIAFNSFKFCCIVQGVYARFRGGVRGAQGANLEAMRRNVEQLAHSTVRSIEFL